ncbi:hypothetical protein FSP39_017820 [Pinctada imbricata]|uniref:RING-type domain-containing protein n=1 Tax=Pinctada imbricata TaxID=66713 RepID=A0AA88XT03_PINIB|nr:hypothetical protein FSP39_017820 [Pinctada imbricata]
MPKRKECSEGTDVERYFLNPESVSVHLYCSICQDVFCEPQRAPCGHSFCKKCILPWLRNSKTCPEDRKRVNPGELHHDFILENIIGDQMVACPYRGTGCEFVGQLQMLSSHKKSCDFNPDNLPDFLQKPSPHETECSPAHPLEDDGSVPTLGKPSLKMRLFRASESQKKLLISMFDEKEDKK